jgi:hypothetical protein
VRRNGWDRSTSLLLVRRNGWDRSTSLL